MGDLDEHPEEVSSACSFFYDFFQLVVYGPLVSLSRKRRTADFPYFYYLLIKIINI